MPLRVLVTVAVALSLAACTSPEATRTRAGGAGADVGNRGGAVELHGGSQPYYATPRILPNVRAGDAASASVK
jgi:hypothetical protein